MKLAKLIESLYGDGTRIKVAKRRGNSHHSTSLCAQVSKRVKITGVRLDNLAVCEHYITELHKMNHIHVTITAKEFFEAHHL